MSYYLSHDSLKTIINRGVLGDLGTLMHRNTNADRVLRLDQASIDFNKDTTKHLALFCKPIDNDPTAYEQTLRLFDYATDEYVKLKDPGVYASHSTTKSSIGRLVPTIADLTNNASDKLGFSYGTLTNVRSHVNSSVYIETFFAVLDGMFRMQLMFDQLGRDGKLECKDQKLLEQFNNNVQVFADRLVTLLGKIEDHLHSTSVQTGPEMLSSMIQRASHAGLGWIESLKQFNNFPNMVQWSEMLEQQDTSAKWETLLNKLHKTEG